MTQAPCEVLGESPNISEAPCLHLKLTECAGKQTRLGSSEPVARSRQRGRNHEGSVCLCQGAVLQHALKWEGVLDSGDGEEVTSGWAAQRERLRACEDPLRKARGLCWPQCLQAGAGRSACSHARARTHTHTHLHTHPHTHPHSRRELEPQHQGCLIWSLAARVGVGVPSAVSSDTPRPPHYPKEPSCPR